MTQKILVHQSLFPIPLPPALEAKWINMGWEVQSVQPPITPRINTRYTATKGRSEFAIFPPFPAMGWEVQSVQPSHPRPERAGSIQIGEDGIKFPFVPPATLLTWGYEPQLIARYKFLKQPSIWDDGIATGLIAFRPQGWEIQSVQPAHPRPERHSATILGDGGIQQTLINWLFAGWEVQPIQPNHPRPEKAAAWMIGDDGIEAQFVPPVPPPPVTDIHFLPFFVTLGKMKSF